MEEHGREFVTNNAKVYSLSGSPVQVEVRIESRRYLTCMVIWSSNDNTISCTLEERGRGS